MANKEINELLNEALSVYYETEDFVLSKYKLHSNNSEKHKLAGTKSVCEKIDKTVADNKENIKESEYHSTDEIISTLNEMMVDYFNYQIINEADSITIGKSNTAKKVAGAAGAGVGAGALGALVADGTIPLTALAGIGSALGAAGPIGLIAVISIAAGVGGGLLAKRIFAKHKEKKDIRSAINSMLLMSDTEIQECMEDMRKTSLELMNVSSKIQQLKLEVSKKYLRKLSSGDASSKLTDYSKLVDKEKELSKKLASQKKELDSKYYTKLQHIKAEFKTIDEFNKNLPNELKLTDTDLIRLCGDEFKELKAEYDNIVKKYANIYVKNKAMLMKDGSLYNIMLDEMNALRQKMEKVSREHLNKLSGDTVDVEDTVGLGSAFKDLNIAYDKHYRDLTVKNSELEKEISALKSKIESETKASGNKVEDVSGKDVEKAIKEMPASKRGAFMANLIAVIKKLFKKGKISEEIIDVADESLNNIKDSNFNIDDADNIADIINMATSTLKYDEVSDVLSVINSTDTKYSQTYDALLNSFGYQLGLDIANILNNQFTDQTVFARLSEKLKTIVSILSDASLHASVEPMTRYKFYELLNKLDSTQFVSTLAKIKSDASNSNFLVTTNNHILDYIDIILDNINKLKDMKKRAELNNSELIIAESAYSFVFYDAENENLNEAEEMTAAQKGAAIGAIIMPIPVLRWVFAAIGAGIGKTIEKLTGKTKDKKIKKHIIDRNPDLYRDSIELKELVKEIKKTKDPEEKKKLTYKYKDKLAGFLNDYDRALKEQEREDAEREAAKEKASKNKDDYFDYV